MKKRLILKVFISVLAVVCLSGCQSKNEGSVLFTEATQNQNPSVELLVWESTNGPDEWIKQAGEKFNEIYPYINIKYENVELNQNVNTLIERISKKSGADLFVAAHDEIGRIINEGLSEPIKNTDDISSRVLSVCSNALTQNGIMYGYPISAETYALYYNKALISEEDLPKTWSDLRDLALSFREKNQDIYPFVMDCGNGYYTSLFLTSNENRLFGKEGRDISSPNVANDEAISGMRMFQSLRDVFDIPAVEISTELADDLFKSGKAAMIISGPWNLFNYSNAGIDFGVDMLPMLDGESTPAYSFTGIRGMFVSSHSEHKDEAALFAEFLTTKEMQKLRYEITGSLPSVDITINNPNTLAFIGQLEFSYPMPSLPQMAVFWEQSQIASRNIWDGYDVEEELKKLEKALIE